MIDHQKLAEDIEANAVDGKVYLIGWGRGCDMCESTELYQIPATVEAYLAKMDSIERNAEGPWSLRIVSTEEAANFRPYFRDRILEGYENGDMYNV